MGSCDIRYSSHPAGGSGRSWIRTSEGISQQIYSLPRLATSVSARERERLAKKAGAVKSDPKVSVIASGIAGRYNLKTRAVSSIG